MNTQLGYPDADDIDGRPSLNFLSSFLWLITFLIVFMHQCILYIYYRRKAPADAPKWQGDFMWRVLVHQLPLHIINVLVWLFLVIFVFGAIRDSYRTPANPDAHGADISGHFATLVPGTLMIQHELMHFERRSIGGYIIVFIGEVFVCFFLYESIFTAAFYHAWYETLIGAVVGALFSLIIYVGLGRIAFFTRFRPYWVVEDEEEEQANIVAAEEEEK